MFLSSSVALLLASTADLGVEESPSVLSVPGAPSAVAAAHQRGIYSLLPTYPFRAVAWWRNQRLSLCTNNHLASVVRYWFRLLNRAAFICVSFLAEDTRWCVSIYISVLICNQAVRK